MTEMSMLLDMLSEISDAISDNAKRQASQTIRSDARG